MSLKRASATETDDLNVRLHQTEMLINIFRPVMEYFGDWNRESGETRGDRSPQLNDEALNVHYTLDPQLEALRTQLSPNGMERYGHIVDFLTAFHVLNRIQETWLVKFTAENENDTWGRVFLDKLKGFGDEFQTLTNYIHTMVTASPMVQPDLYDEVYFEFRGLWENTALKFFGLLLFLFDVGLRLEVESYDMYDDGGFPAPFDRHDHLNQLRMQESPAFTSTSTFRRRILASAEFITHLEMCAWKVLNVSWGIRQPYQLSTLAIPHVCDELRVRIREWYARSAAKADPLDRRGAVAREIKMALDWRSEWSRAGSGGMMENYRKIYRKMLADLQLEHSLKLAFIRKDQQETDAHRRAATGPQTSDLTVARLLTLLQDAKEAPYTSALCCSASH